MSAANESAIAMGVVLAIACGACADMMPVSRLDAAPLTSGGSGSKLTLLPDSLIGRLAVALDVPVAAFWPLLGADVDPTEVQAPLYLLKIDGGGFGLFVSSLPGRSSAVPWTDRRSGDRSQIGDSYAIGPDGLGAATACFLRPGSTADDFVYRHRLETVRSPWHPSRAVSTILAP